jgi:hypothetical protein
MKTTAYLRIPTIDQDIEKNKADILKLAHGKQLGSVHFIEHIASTFKNWIILNLLSSNLVYTCIDNRL